MKYKITAIVVAIGILLGSGLVWAEGKYQTIQVYFDRIQVRMNGQNIPLSKNSIVYNGTVYLPMRDLSNGLGADITWNQTNNTIDLDFIIDRSDKAFEASQKAIYQYIAVQNNQIMSEMIDLFESKQVDKIKQLIKRYETLRVLAANLDDQSMAERFDKLKVSAELLRTGWNSKNMDDYYLAWNIFKNNSVQLNALLKLRITDNLIVVNSP